MNKTRKAIIEANEISQVREFCLGGYNQKVLIEGRKNSLPVIISLHGGPGMPIPFSVGCRGLFPEFTNHFIMVYWDQLGCGINNFPIDDSFTIEHFVNMTEELIRAIHKMFPQNPIHIFSTSWGSILSVMVLERVSDIVKGVVACGQLVKNVFLSDEVYNELKNASLPAKKLNAIRNMRAETITHKDLRLVSSSIRTYTNGYQNRKGDNPPMGKIIWGLLTSPDYKFKDFLAIMANGYLKNISLWKEILQLNLESELLKIQIPYSIIQGDTDIVASTKTVLSVVERNQNLTCKVVPNAGHYPNTTMMQTLIETLKEQVYK